MLNLDLDGAFKGKLPWSVKEWHEVYQWYRRLQETPKDDWDLDEMGLTEGQLEAIPPESLRLMQELIDKGLLSSTFALFGAVWPGLCQQKGAFLTIQ